jgi:hypothetical protein
MKCDGHREHEGRFAVNVPYIVMLLLALFGVAYTSVARHSMLQHWVLLTPIFALICVMTRWRDLEDAETRWIMLRTESLHWGAVLLTMLLSFIANAQQMMNADASALMALAILALGTLGAGVHITHMRCRRRTRRGGADYRLVRGGDGAPCVGRRRDCGAPGFLRCQPSNGAKSPLTREAVLRVYS